MSNLSTSMKKQLRRSNPNLRMGVAFAFSDGTERFSDVSWCSRNLGLHENSVMDWGQIRSAVADRRNSMEVASWSGMKILDRAGRWKARDARGELRGTPVTLTYGSRLVDPLDWLDPRFSGVLLDWNIKEGVVSINEVGPPFLLALRAPVPQERVTLAGFTELPDEAVDVWGGLCYGRHDSFAFGKLTKGDNDGQITPLYVGEYTEKNLLGNEVTGSRFLICQGPISAIVHTYESQIKIADALWNQQSIYQEVNGVLWSRIQYKSNRSTKKITLDVDGYAYGGAHATDIIIDPVEQIVHFLTNFVFGKYKTGPWLTNPVFVNAARAALASLYLGHLRIPIGYVGARFIEAAQERRTAIEYLNEWTQSGEMKSYTTFGGEVGFGADSYDDPGYIDEPHIRRPYHELLSGPLIPTRIALDAAKRIAGETANSQALGTFTERLMVLSQKAVEESADSVSCPWGPAHL